MSDSYPPHLLRLPGSAPGSPARGALEADRVAAPLVVPAAGQQGAPSTLLASPGQPGTYAPHVAPAGRPRNMTELAAQVTPATPEPWPEGDYLLVGVTGKRAHWAGDHWRNGVSPGYAAGELVTVRSETEQTGLIISVGGEQT